MYIRILIILASLLLTSCVQIRSSDEPLPVISGEKPPEIYQATLDADTKITLAKKRKSYMSGIRKGDYYSLRNNPEEALAYYLQVAEKLPNDQIVRKKIAHVYALQKNWKAAYENYIQVPLLELNENEKTEMLQALFFDEGQLDRIGELIKMPYGTGETDYYRVVDICYTGIHNCVVSIQSYSGTSSEILALQKTITDAPAITPDLHYRNLLIAAKLYEQGMYGASSRIAYEILRDRPDYLEVMKVYAFSLYELGEYSEAKKYLLAYLEKEPTDLESMVRLGETYGYLGDIVSSNLSLNNAIIAGYTPKTDIERRLAYNYSLLSDAPGMLKVLNYLLQEDDVREDDFAVAVSFALSEGDNTRARSWALEGIQKFELSPMLVPLYIEALRLSGDRDLAKGVIAEVTPDSPILENPNFLLQKAIIAFEEEQYDASKEIFEELVDMDEWPAVVEEASLYITSIDRLTSSGGLFD